MDNDGGRRLETPGPKRAATRRSEDATRRSRSHSRRGVSAVSGRIYRHRSRSPVHVVTPRRSRSRARREVSERNNTPGIRSRSPAHRSGHGLSLEQRERELKRERERLRVLEEEILRERQRSRSRHSELIRNEGHTSRLEDSREQNRSHSNRGTCTKRSDSPTFTSKDVIDIIKSLKHNNNTSSPQPLTETANNLNHKNILPSFDPSTKNQRVDIWLKKVNECATVYGWDEKTIIHFAMQKLEGLAKTWYESLNSILFSWTEWQQKLTSAFPFEQNYGQSLEDMLKRKSKYNEPIEVYFYEKLALLNQCDIEGKRAVDCIIHGLSDKTAKSSALALRCSQPDELLQYLMSNKESTNIDRPFHRNRYFSDSRQANNNSDNKNPNRSAPSNVNPSVFCFNCKERGHPYMKCPKPLVKCTICHKFGHLTENCRNKQDDNANKNNKTDINHKTMCISTSKSNTKFNKEVYVNDLPVRAFVDFGSTVSIITTGCLASLGLKCDGISVPLKGFGNDIVNSLGSVAANLIVDGVKAEVNFQVVDDKFLDVPVLIGQSFTELPHIVVYKDAQELKFFDQGTEMPFVTDDIENDKIVKLTSVSNARIFGPATIKVRTDSKFDGTVLINGKIMGKPSEQYTVLGGLYRVSHGLASICITPVSPHLEIIMGLTVCRAMKVQVVNRIICPKMENLLTENVYIDKNMVRVGDAANEQDKQRLYDILQKYKHCFAFTLKELGCTDVTEMTIEITSKQPIVYRPYRLSHKEREHVRGMVDEMLDAGIIRESVSEYASPIILVRKSDGKLRMCIDYRLLNSVTVKERYPMPIIEDEIARLSGQAVFITLDLASGYYQVPISESSKSLTSFVTPDGQYEFNRMPFGLANAPAVFQRMMNRVLGSARYTEAMAYIDDVLIYGQNVNECLARLEKVLKLLEDAKLTLNLAKCEFLMDKITYLGYEISASGVRPGDKKIQSVLEFPTPTNQHTVRQFLGLVGYFRKFIQNFAQIAYPLSKLLKKDAMWSWREEQENAFATLKDKLIKRPILAIYDPAAETELHTDASKLGIGGILLQRTNESDTFRPVAYYSRQTTPDEKHFHAYELETLAVVCSLKKFRVYLLGRNFKIVTDCSALRSTFSKRDIIPRVARWWLLFQEYQCSIDYRAGSKMAHVDALSRNPSPNEDVQNALDNYPMVMSITNEDWLQTLQLGDSELCRIRNILSTNIDVEGLKHITDNYVLKDEKLYKYIDDDKTKLRWVVPKGARWQICRMNHDDIGHFGVEKTLERIKKSYWFPKMSRFIKKYVQSCVQCAYSKTNNQPNKEGLLHPIEKVEVPFHTVHIDHLGPFVRSKRGNTHLLVIVEAFTKFVFIKPVRNTNAQNVIRSLEDVFYTFRCPDRIISDRGSCFTSHAFRRFCLDKGIKHVLNAVASPRSNGQVERYNRTILDSLTAQNLNCNEKEWDNKVGTVQWGLNNTKQKTTGRTPAEVMFGTAMNAELEPKLNEVVRDARDNSDVIDIRAEVRDRIEEQQKKQKENYDKGRKPARTYNKGDLVKLRKVSFNNDGKSTKLLPSYIGPYRVVSVVGNDRYKLSAIPGLTSSKNKRKTTVSADRMLPWVNIASLDVQSNDSNDDNDDDSDIDN